MILIHDLHQMAHGLGVQLVHHDGGDKGWFSETYRVISTRRRMPVWDYKSTLAHELAHAVFRDRRSGHTYFDQRQEDRADLYAARMLINHDELHHHALWPSRTGTPLMAPGHDSWLDKAVKRCQENDPTFPRVTAHGLRHVAAGLLVNAGASVKVVQRQLGHKHASMTLDRYAELWDDGLDEISATVDGLFSAHEAG